MAEDRDSQPSLEERLRSVEFRRFEMGDTERRAPHIDPRWLEEHGTASRIERIWQRLAPQIGSSPRSARLRPVVAVCAAAAVFALGLGVGRLTMLEPVVVADSDKPEGLLEPEPQLYLDPTNDTPGAAQHTPAPGQLSRQNTARRLRGVTPSRARTGEAVVVAPLLEEEVASPSLTVAPPPRWLTLANSGDYQLAFQAVDEAGGFDSVVAHASAEELMTLADVARAAGQPGRAVQALREVLSRDESDPNAPVAAMMLGNLLQRAGDYAGANEAYALNRRLSPQGDFAEDALARQFDVALDKGDLARARALSAQYETEFPDGRRLGEIREQLRRAESEAAQAAASDGKKPSSGKPSDGEQTSDDGEQVESDAADGSDGDAHGAGAESSPAPGGKSATGSKPASDK